MRRNITIRKFTCPYILFRIFVFNFSYSRFTEFWNKTQKKKKPYKNLKQNKNSLTLLKEIQGTFNRSILHRPFL